MVNFALFFVFQKKNGRAGQSGYAGWACAKKEKFNSGFSCLIPFVKFYPPLCFAFMEHINLTRKAKLGPGATKYGLSSKAKLFSQQVQLINVGGAGQYITGMCGPTFCRIYYALGEIKAIDCLQQGHYKVSSPVKGLYLSGQQLQATTWRYHVIRLIKSMGRGYERSCIDKGYRAIMGCIYMKGYLTFTLFMGLWKMRWRC